MKNNALLMQKLRTHTYVGISVYSDKSFDPGPICNPVFTSAKDMGSHSVQNQQLFCHSNEP